MGPHSQNCITVDAGGPTLTGLERKKKPLRMDISWPPWVQSGENHSKEGETVFQREDFNAKT
jgi:hypothetical protein